MWSRFFKLFELVLNFYGDLQKLKETSKQHSQQLRALAEHQTRLYYEYQIQRERDAREREREAHQRELNAIERERTLAVRESAVLKRETGLLRRENQLLREGLSLPPARTEPNED